MTSKTEQTTPPTPDEIAAALDTLRRVPDLSGRITAALDDIEHTNSPHHRMAADLHGWWTKSMGSPIDLEIELRAAAARHGLRITTDPVPGELVGYYAMAPADEQMHIKWIARHLSPGTLADAAEAARDRFDSRLAVMHLLPEGGQR